MKKFEKFDNPVLSILRAFASTLVYSNGVYGGVKAKKILANAEARYPEDSVINVAAKMLDMVEFSEQNMQGLILRF